MRGTEGIIVHDAFKGETIAINISAINAVRKLGDGEEDYGSVIYVEGERFIVKETFDVIILKIGELESEAKNDT